MDLYRKLLIDVVDELKSKIRLWRKRHYKEISEIKALEDAKKPTLGEDLV
jgi:hypothetical protein